jgi:hypothetical protein
VRGKEYGNTLDTKKAGQRERRGEGIKKMMEQGRSFLVSLTTGLVIKNDIP